MMRSPRLMALFHDSQEPEENNSLEDIVDYRLPQIEDSSELSYKAIS